MCYNIGIKEGQSIFTFVLSEISSKQKGKYEKETSNAQWWDGFNRNNVGVHG